MRVLIISPNREHLPDPVFPLGIAYIASALKGSGHEVRVADLCFEEDIEAALRQSISSFYPEAIGISIRNIDDVTFPKQTCYLPLYKEVVRICRKYCDSPMIAGGAGFTIMPKEFMRALDLDYGVVGEGEKTLLTLLEYINKGGELPQGIVTRNKTSALPLRSDSWGNVRPIRNIFDTGSYY